MSQDFLCEFCGVWMEEHGYEHEARECMPKQIEWFQKEASKAEAELSRVRAERDDLRMELDNAQAPEGQHKLVMDLVSTTDYCGHGKALGYALCKLADRAESAERDRDELKALCERYERVLRLAQSLVDDVDQGHRSSPDEEWRIPWSRHAVEVFSEIAKALTPTREPDREEGTILPPERVPGCPAEVCCGRTPCGPPPPPPAPPGRKGP